ncbi:MAG: putative glycosyltransferase [Bacteroidetes bacterium]|nr:putative glycosyltransferase [Bacteroidota bacterium]
MSKPRHGDTALPLLTVFLDAIAIESAFLASYWLRFNSTLFDTLGFVREAAPPFRSYVLTSFVIVAAWLMLFQARKMYGVRRAVSLSDELVNIVKVVSLGILLVLAAAFFYREFSYSRVVVILLYVLAILFLFTGRALVHALERRWHRRGMHLQDAVIIGTEPPAGTLYERLHMHPSFGFRITGYFGDAGPAPDMPLNRATRMGTLADAPAHIARSGVDLAFIAVRPDEHPALVDLIARCEGYNITFMMVPDVLEIMTSRVTMHELEGIPLLKIKSVPFTAWGRITKRAFDLVVAGAASLIALPLGGAIALLVRLDSPGPVFFKQKRVGLDNREFTMLKFRSMRQGSEVLDHAAGLGVARDPRRTRLGKILRATSLDELPQLLNVLAGDMSLVGPRPERTSYVEQFSESVPKYLDRHRVKAGITGWAQVNGLRGDTSIEERIRYDLFYIENWSLAFDLKILLRTLRAAITTHESRPS